MRNTLQVLATIKANSAGVSELRGLLRSAVKKFRAEPGCEGYVLLEDRKQPGRFLTYETWRDEASLAAHMKSPTMTALTPQLKTLIDGEIKQDLLAVLVES